MPFCHRVMQLLTETETTGHFWRLLRIVCAHCPDLCKGPVSQSPYVLTLIGDAHRMHILQAEARIAAALAANAAQLRERRAAFDEKQTHNEERRRCA